jgi:hypothetical protein
MTNMRSEQSTTIYGSLPTSEEEAPHKQQRNAIFDSDKTYYLKDESKWTPQKIVSMAIPLIGAVLIIGGAVTFLLRDFNHLYPGRGVSDSSEPITSRSTVRTRSTPVSTKSQQQTMQVPASAQVTKMKNGTLPISTTSSTASCLMYSECLGLIGECCPTDSGIFLACCY